MTDKQLIRLLKQEPEQGLETVMELYGGALKTICQNCLTGGTREDVEEAVSDVLAAIWRAAGRFDAKKGTSFKSYCYGIARKTALTKRSNLMKTAQVLPLDEDILEIQDETESLLEHREEERILHQVIDSRPEPQRSVFILRYFYFFPIKEIAAWLGIADKRVENLLFRGKQKLKTSLIERGIER